MHTHVHHIYTNAQMIAVGCSTGPVQLEFAHFLRLEAVVLAKASSASTFDPIVSVLGPFQLGYCRECLFCSIYFDILHLNLFWIVVFKTLLIIILRLLMIYDIIITVTQSILASDNNVTPMDVAMVAILLKVGCLLLCFMRCSWFAQYWIVG